LPPLGPDEFWQTRLPEAREAVSWEKILRLLVVNRLLDPGSEFHVHRQWFVDSAMDEVLETDLAVDEKDRLYRCLDQILKHKQELFIWLKQKWADLFHADFEVLLYDLTSTYFEGRWSRIPKPSAAMAAINGRTVVLVVTPDGFPLAYEVMNGNTSDRQTLRGFLKKIEDTYGTARRVWVMQSLPKRDQLLLRIGAAKKAAGRAFGFVKIQIPKAGQEVTRETFFVSGGQGQVKGRPAATALSAAQQSYRRRSRSVVDAVCTIDADRECLSLSATAAYAANIGQLCSFAPLAPWASCSW
jgi:hypothetical protein